jgi:hypothetical protein
MNFYCVRSPFVCAGWNEGSTVAEAPQEAGFPGEISNISGLQQTVQC